MESYNLENRPGRVNTKYIIGGFVLQYVPMPKHVSFNRFQWVLSIDEWLMVDNIISEMLRSLEPIWWNSNQMNDLLI